MLLIAFPSRRSGVPELQHSARRVKRANSVDQWIRKRGSKVFLGPFGHDEIRAQLRAGGITADDETLEARSVLWGAQAERRLGSVTVYLLTGGCDPSAASGRIRMRRRVPPIAVGGLESKRLSIRGWPRLRTGDFRHFDFRRRSHGAALVSTVGHSGYGCHRCCGRDRVAGRWNAVSVVGACTIHHLGSGPIRELQYAEL